MQSQMQISSNSMSIVGIITISWLLLFWEAALTGSETIRLGPRTKKTIGKEWGRLLGDFLKEIYDEMFIQRIENSWIDEFFKPLSYRMIGQVVKQTMIPGFSLNDAPFFNSMIELFSKAFLPSIYAYTFHSFQIIVRSTKWFSMKEIILKYYSTRFEMSRSARQGNHPKWIMA